MINRASKGASDVTQDLELDDLTTKMEEAISRLGFEAPAYLDETVAFPSGSTLPAW